MTCFYPLAGWRGASPGPSGKRPIVFSLKDACPDRPVTIPCGQCVGCRLERSRQWAVRCVHEAAMHDRNVFVTLTYAPEHCPIDGGLRVRDHQLFMKRLRKRFGSGIRFYMCGEYGETTLRPHYHYLLFNCDFTDKQLFTVRNGFRCFTSQALSEIWPFGHSVIGDVTFQSAGYVARYVMKKITGDMAEDHYRRFDSNTGEVFDVLPEFNKMSLGAGIGFSWIQRYGKEVLRRDSVVINGHECRPPRFYDQCLELLYPDEVFSTRIHRRDLFDAGHCWVHNRVRLKRVLNNASRGGIKDGSTRLRVREICTETRVSNLVRNVE